MANRSNKKKKKKEKTAKDENDTEGKVSVSVNHLTGKKALQGKTYDRRKRDISFNGLAFQLALRYTEMLMSP